MYDQDNPVPVAHRLLAPRIAYLIGTKDSGGVTDLIPVSNVTSVSTSPQHVLLAVLKEWTTYRNLLSAPGFTLSVPMFDQLDEVWKLGARYSRYPFTEPSEKIKASGASLDNCAAPYGPVLTDGIGWLSARIVDRRDLGGDHGIAVGEVERVWFNPEHLGPDGIPVTEVRPVMQQTGNRFTTAGECRTIPYFQ